MSESVQPGRKASIDPSYAPYELPQTPPQSQSPRPLKSRGSTGRLNTIKRLGTSAGPLRGSGQPPALKVPNDSASSKVPTTTPAASPADEDIVPPLWFTLKTIPPVLVAAVLGGMYLVPLVRLPLKPTSYYRRHYWLSWMVHTLAWATSVSAFGLCLWGN
jgi:hypothetical protein